MNKREINKLMLYFFEFKDYGVKELNKDYAWLLKKDSECPIICIALKKKINPQLIQEKYSEYQQLLQTNEKLMLLNNDYQDEYIMDQPFNTQLLTEYMNSWLANTNFFDATLRSLQMRFKHRKGMISWVSIFIAIYSLMSYLAYTSQAKSFSFLAGGYFRFAMLYHDEYYRFITGLFMTQDLRLLCGYIGLLIFIERIFKYQHTVLKFIAMTIFTSFISNVLLIISNVETIYSGLSSVVVAFLALELLKPVILIYKKILKIRVLRYRNNIICMLGIILIGVFDFYPAVFGVICAIIALYYIYIKENRTSKINFKIALVFLLVGLFVRIADLEKTPKTINYETYRLVKQEKHITYPRYGHLINSMEDVNEK